MPSFTYPTNVFKWLAFQSMVLSYDCNIKTIHALLLDRTQ